MSQEHKPVEITVVVKGRPGSGKSAVVRIIADALAEAGISHFAYDEEDQAEALRLQTARVESLRRNVHIKIKTRSPAKSKQVP